VSSLPSAGVAQPRELPADPVTRPPAAILPGLAHVAALVGAAYAVARLTPAVNVPIWAFAFGVLAGPTIRAAAVPIAGIRFAATTLLRAGVALLGLNVAASQLLSLGPVGAAIAVTTVVVTLTMTVALGRCLGLGQRISLLIATGSAICGASAIAAMASVTRAREDDVGYALMTVTLFGTLAMVATPLAARHVLGLDADETGLWLGASIHEVAQVAGAGAALSGAALQVAVLTKLTRVVMLAPAIACVAALHGERKRLLAVPGFVVAFLALAAVRSVAGLPAPVLEAGRTMSTLLLCAGLTALGMQIRVRSLAVAGVRPLVLGLAAWLIASGTALSLVVLLR
jgi:uncharacterized integral membrane protein (TIGR00698 family)